jgi:hypothetical protein
MCGERVPQRVRRYFLGDSCKGYSAGDCPTDRLLILMVSTANFGARVNGQGGRRENPMPSPTLRGAWKFARQCVWQPNTRQLMGAILHPDRPRMCDLRLQGSSQWLRKHDDAILLALALTHDDDLAIKVDVLDSQAQTFHQAEA